jgi:hypothetical protein
MIHLAQNLSKMTVNFHHSVNSYSNMSSKSGAGGAGFSVFGMKSLENQ